MKITKKSLLIELLSGVQVVCLTTAMLCSAFWIRAQVQGIVRKQIVSDNQLIAAQMSKLIDRTNIESVEFGSDGWEELQTLIEEVELPNEGYMCVTNHDGSLICHPEMRNNPKLRQMVIGSGTIRVAGLGQPMREAMNHVGTAGASAVTGIVGGGNASEVVSIARLSGLESILLVHQSERGFRTAVNALLLPIGFSGLVVGLGLVLVTKKVSVGVLNQYENKLADINANLEETVRKRTRSLMKTRNAIIFGLAKLAESRDTDTGQHLDRIRSYVTALAKKLSEKIPSINDTYIENLALASSLHDIGKVGIPDSVLLKPGRFTPQERRVMERHSALGGDCLHAIQEQLGEDDFLSLSTEIAYYHHERWDGTGYPTQKKQIEIPLSARIVALADVYDALTSKRPYKEPMSHERAKKIILEGSGSHFDPDVVAAFTEAETAFLAIAAECNQDDAALSTVALLSQELNANPTGPQPEACGPI